MSALPAIKLDRDREFILLKHKLRDLNGFINGVKFRGGIAAVVKGSKNYHILRKLPLINEELPLIYLKNLKFITRTSDVGLIYGKKVYNQYIHELANELAKTETARTEIDESEHVKKGLCNFRVGSGNLCKQQALEVSPSGYCRMHILQDPRLKEFEIEVPRLSKVEKKQWKKKVIKQLTKLKKKEEF